MIPTDAKLVAINFSELIEDADDMVGAYGDANPVSVDTQGFAHCQIVVYVGTTDVAMTALGVYEGASAASGADDSNFTAITGLQASGSSGAGRLPQGDDDDTFFIFDVDCRSTERYLALDATAGNGSSGTWVHAFAILTRGDEGPSTATERGAAWVLDNS